MIPILTYHQIDAAPPRGAPFRSLYVSPASFARQMRLLRLLGYQGLSMTALAPYLRGEKTGRVVGITFDDGYVNNLTHALPVLQRNGFSSTCYAVSGLAGQTNLWDTPLGVVPSALMKTDQMRAWLAGGQEIGAHTCHHVHLNALSADAARAEIAGSKAALEQMIQSPVHHFCYPYGEYAPAHVAMVREAGFATATSTKRSRCAVVNVGNGAGQGDGLFELSRVPVMRSTTLPVFWMKVATRYEDKHV